MTQETSSLPVMDVAGTSREMGRSHGEQCRQSIRREIERYLTPLARKWHLTPADSAERFRAFEPLFECVAPWLLEEMSGIAEGAGTSFAEILFLNARHGGVGVLAEQDSAGEAGCTAFAAAGPAVAGGGVLAGQNKDTSTAALERYYLLRTRPRKGPRVLALTYPGEVGHLGIGSGGVAVFGNALRARRRPFGGPHNLFRRPVLESSSLAEAAAICDRLEAWTEGNFVVADAHGSLASFELIGGKRRGLAAIAHVITHANHILHPDLEKEEVYPARAVESEPRRQRLEELLRANFGQLTVQHCMAALRDHQHRPHSICRHNDQPGAGVPIVTTCALVAEVGEGRMHVCPGSPCRNEFTEYGFD